MTVTYPQLVEALAGLGVERSHPVIVHASLSAFGQVAGGAQTVVDALTAVFPRLMAPTFTYKTVVIPEAGPPDNALVYGSGRDINRMAAFYHPGMPADRLMGAVAEALRHLPQARRGNHPILSFSGVNVDAAIKTQSLAEPLAPIGELARRGGWVLLMGVDHTANTSIHHAERLGGRKGFTRWALTPAGALKCPGFPGCSHGFQAIAPRLKAFGRQVRVRESEILAIPLRPLIQVVRDWISDEPQALLCSRTHCLRCQTRRRAQGSQA